jgi:hypothetical protein
MNVLGASGGGNLSSGQIESIEATNEGFLGVGIDLVGKIDINEDGSITFSPAATNFIGVTADFTCNSGSDSDCKSGFTFTLDFGSIDWQIVKVAVKAAGPTNPNGIFFVCDIPGNGACQGNELSGEFGGLQTGTVSFEEWANYCGGSNAVTNTANCSFNPGISHFLVWGVQGETTVPEPATLTVLGLGLVGIGIAARKRLRK